MSKRSTKQDPLSLAVFNARYSQRRQGMTRDGIFVRVCLLCGSERRIHPNGSVAVEGGRPECCGVVEARRK